MTKLQTKFLNALDDYGYDIFSLKMIKDIQYLSDKEIMQALRTLINSGLIRKLERGKYLKNGFGEDFVIGSFLVDDGGIAYWSALNAHGLTEQFPNTVFVQTAKRNGVFKFNNLKYKFIRVNKRKITGYRIHGFGNHSFRMTDVEKTIVDCFDLPHNAGWYHEIIKAFNNAKINARKMVKYCQAIGNISVVKRIGFLCEFLKKSNMDFFINYAQNVLGKEYSLFEIDGEKKGAYNNRWKLIINMPEQEIMNIAKS